LFQQEKKIQIMTLPSKKGCKLHSGSEDEAEVHKLHHAFEFLMKMGFLLCWRELLGLWSSQSS
jgi:hypothetical protein